MRAISNMQKVQQRLDKERRIRQRERERIKKERENIEQTKKTMEWGRVRRRYPDSEYKQLTLKNIHPELRIRFNTKCISEGATTVGKLRWFMWACINDRIDDAAVNQAVISGNMLEEYGPIPKKMPHEFSMNLIPEELHLEFKQWCSLRGYTISGKLRQLMVCYIKGILD